MQATVQELAALVDGRLVGDGSVVIHGASPLCSAGPGQITLTDDSVDRRHKLAESQAAAVVMLPSGVTDGRPAIRVDDVHGAFATIISHFRPPRAETRIGISSLASISPSARIEEDVDVHPHATIGKDVCVGSGTTIHAGAHVMSGAQIGQDVTVFPGAVIYENTVVGPRCIIHANAVLGAYGFGYCSDSGRHELSSQLGNVVLEADVEVGAATTIDRGTYGPTVIGEGTKIDNLVMVAHNCQIGKHNMLCSQVGVAGSTSTGDYVVMAGQVGVRDHVHIGKGAVLGAMAGVINDVTEGEQMIGIPATPQREQKIKQAALAKLPEMRRQLKKLQATVNKMVAAQETDQGDPPRQHRAVA